MAMTCSAMGFAYAPTLLAITSRSGMAAKSTPSAPAGMQLDELQPGRAGQRPVGQFPAQPEPDQRVGLAQCPEALVSPSSARKRDRRRRRSARGC